MEIQYLIIPVVFLGIILINISIGKHIINKALRKFIIPKLKENGFRFEKYKWVGLLSVGDFKEESMILRPSITGGRPIIATYVYVYYQDSGVTKRVTVKIETLFMFIRKVTYSSAL